MQTQYDPTSTNKCMKRLQIFIISYHQRNVNSNYKVSPHTCIMVFSKTKKQETSQQDLAGMQRKGNPLVVNANVNCCDRDGKWCGDALKFKKKFHL